MPELMVRIDDVAVPLRDCFWVLFDPNGCAVGSCTGESAANAESAHLRFTPRQRDRDRQARQGYLIELLHRPQWREKAQACFLGKCEHGKKAAA